MSFGIKMLLANAISLASIIIAGVMAFHDKSGWGWFLAMSVASLHTVSTQESKR